MGEWASSGMPFDLSPLEARVLGCLMEKERLTPENYPLSLNSLTAACNQSTNRDPITHYDEKEVENGISALREKKLATMISMAGSRVPKYRHRLTEHFSLEPQEAATLCVLLLRGPQTLGEIRTRTERMFRFGSLDEVAQCLQDLEKDPAGLVSLLPHGAGQKESRYRENLSAAVIMPEQAPAVVGQAAAVSPGSPLPERIAVLGARVEELEGTVVQLKEELAAFRKQFE
jgi:uncharacterized protein YceH (UPF0502 family)